MVCFFIKLSLLPPISRADQANDALSERKTNSQDSCAIMPDAHNISIHKRYAADRKNRLAVLRAKIRPSPVLPCMKSWLTWSTLRVVSSREIRSDSDASER
jgi:hypothetical protein